MIWLILFTALASWLATFAVLRLAPRLGLVHEPNDRSSHSVMVPHGGGLGIVLAGSLAGSLLVSPLTPTPLPEGEGLRILAVLGLALPLAVVGLVDDIRHVSARIRFVVQGASVAVLLWLMGP